MKLDVSMTTETNEFLVQRWWAMAPDFAHETFRAQLAAATVIWPELARFSIHERSERSMSVRGAKGGHARAAALTPEKRSEVATKAANARWHSDDRVPDGDGGSGA